MPTDYENRRTNLRRLIEQWGGPSTLSAKLGYSNASFLVQMAGPNPIREVSEKTARRIEKKLDLHQGFLDSRPEKVEAVDISIKLVTDVVRVVAQACQDAGLKLSPTKFADLVSLVYEDAAQHGKLRGDFLKSIIQLAK